MAGAIAPHAATHASTLWRGACFRFSRADVLLSFIVSCSSRAEFVPSAAGRRRRRHRCRQTTTRRAEGWLISAAASRLAASEAPSCVRTTLTRICGLRILRGSCFRFQVCVCSVGESRMKRLIGCCFYFVRRPRRARALVSPGLKRRPSRMAAARP